MTDSPTSSAASSTLPIRCMPSGAAPDPIPLPTYGTVLAAGLDLSAAVRAPVILKPGERVLIPCGFAMAIPAGFEGQVRPRSGRALRDGLTVLNSPGTIDADYRGELKVILINLGQAAITLSRGERVAQLVIAPVVQMPPRWVTTLDETRRGAQGFGHTGQ